MITNEFLKHIKYYINERATYTEFLKSHASRTKTILSLQSYNSRFNENLTPSLRFLPHYQVLAEQQFGRRG